MDTWLGEAIAEAHECVFISYSTASKTPMSEAICKYSRTFGIKNMLSSTHNYLFLHVNKVPWVMAMWLSRRRANGA